MSMDALKALAISTLGVCLLAGAAAWEINNRARAAWPDLTPYLIMLVGFITIFYGEDTGPEEAKTVGERVRRTYSEQDVEVVAGGQPYYYYILSAE